MDKPIEGDKYIRTLSHYLRTNRNRLLPSTQSNSATRNQGNGHDASTTYNASTARSLVTPSDPMAAAYAGMVNSLWSVGTAVVSTMAASPGPNPQSSPGDGYKGAWDGTGSINPNISSTERHLQLQAQIRAPIFPLDLYYLMYLLERFEEAGIELEGWEGTTPRTIGDSKPRVLINSNNNNTSTNNKGKQTGGQGQGQGGLPMSSTYSSFPPPASPRPQSIRSFSSTAMSTLTLITGWKQWSTAASSNTQKQVTITDDIHAIQQFLKKLPSLRLVSKIPPGHSNDHNGGSSKGRIENFTGNSMLFLFQAGKETTMTDDHEPLSLGEGAASSSLSSANKSNNNNNNTNTTSIYLPLASTFSSLTHLELHKIPPRCIDGWEVLMGQLKSLVILQSDIEDVHDVLVQAVVQSEVRRRNRIWREENRAEWIKEERLAAQRDAELAIKADSSAKSPTLPAPPTSSSSSAKSVGTSATMIAVKSPPQFSEDQVLQSLDMWPLLRHAAFSDNSLPQLDNSKTFSYTPAVVSLDLSHNLLLSPPSGLIHLHNLENLNLSFNMITSVQAIYQILGNISVLDLRGNRLESLCGLERLWNLEKVDVRENNLQEAAEVGRLAALPQIREVWSEGNIFCTVQPKYRLQILAVFKANGHDLLLDGTFASYTEKRSLSNLSPSAFSTTISSINNLANIPAASAPLATFSKELTGNHPVAVRPVSMAYPDLSAATSTNDATAAAIATTTTTVTTPPVPRLVKKKLRKASKVSKRIVDLDSDHEHESRELGADSPNAGVAASDDDEEHHRSHHHVKPEEDRETFKASILGSPASIGRKKKNGTSKKIAEAAAAAANVNDDGEVKVVKPKKKVVKKKSTNGLLSAATIGGNGPAGVSFAEDADGSIHTAECRDNHHVHRLSGLEQTMMKTNNNNTYNNNGSNNNNNGHRSHTTLITSPQPGRSILKKNHTDGGAMSPRLRPSSPIGSFSSDDGGADGYRRKIEAMRNEAGTNWLKVLNELDQDSK